MLKKAGMVFAVSALGLLAVSPLAFAGDMGGDWGHKGHEGHRGHSTSDPQVNSVESGSHSSGLVAIGDINALNDINVCPAIPVGVGLGNLLGILGQGTGLAAPSADDTTCVVDKSIDQDNDN